MNGLLKKERRKKLWKVRYETILWVLKLARVFWQLILDGLEERESLLGFWYDNGFWYEDLICQDRSLRE